MKCISMWVGNAYLRVSLTFLPITLLPHQLLIFVMSQCLFYSRRGNSDSDTDFFLLLPVSLDTLLDLPVSDSALHFCLLITNSAWR